MKNPISKLAAKWRAWSGVQRGLVVGLVLGLSLLVLRPISSIRTMPAGHRDGSAHPPGDNQPEYLPAPARGQQPSLEENDLKHLQAALGAAEKAAVGADRGRIDETTGTRLSPTAPLIAHTAELALATKEFSRSRTSLQEILDRHRGYAARLRMVGQKGGSLLNATLRVPSTELNETVSELKSLGDVEREEQSADEITQQRADLEARLTNAQNTLRRLQELLKKQTYPDGNVRSLQQQIANATAELSQLEAERQASEHRVVFANVFLTLREDVAKPSESLAAQLRAAAAAGFGEAMASLAGLLMILIARGPVLVLWAAILYVPARWMWKKWAPVTTRPTAAIAGN